MSLGFGFGGPVSFYFDEISCNSVTRMGKGGAVVAQHSFFLLQFIQALCVSELPHSPYPSSHHCR